MKYAYENLSEDQFEKLIVLLCQKLLGISVQGFSKGPDGGRDAKFVGVAQLHPSTAAPWKGTTIVQAKHTVGYNRNFSESDFFSPGSVPAASLAITFIFFSDHSPVPAGCPLSARSGRLQ